MSKQKTKKILTAKELAKLEGVSFSYISRLCRLPASDPKHIKAVKLHGRMWAITDEKFLKKYQNKYCSDI